MCDLCQICNWARTVTATTTSLQLALPPGTITWWTRNLESTINLMFVSVAITPQVTACRVAEYLE